MYVHLKFSRASVVQFRASRYVMRLNRRSEWKVMTVGISWELSLFNFEHLDILCARTGHPCKTLWRFEFVKSFHYSISSLSIYYVTESDLCVKSYEHLNFSRASVVQFWASQYIMRLIQTYVWKVMTILISCDLPVFNFERVDMWWIWIGHPREKLITTEFVQSFRCSISSVSIYYAPESDFHVKS